MTAREVSLHREGKKNAEDHGKCPNASDTNKWLSSHFLGYGLREDLERISGRPVPMIARE